MSAARALAFVALLAAALAPQVRAGSPPDDVALYRHWCSRCHGDDGDGRGLAAAALVLNGHPPRDFTRGVFKWKSTRHGEGPTDGDLRRTIERGLVGTSMPYFSDLLSADDIGRLLSVVRGFAVSPRRAGAPIAIDPPPQGPDPEARGASLYIALGCPGCHGVRGDGEEATAADLHDEDGTLARPADLTRPWTFRSGAGPADIAMRLAAGIEGTPMPSYLGAAPMADLWAVAHYVRSLARAPSLRASAIDAAKRPAGANQQPRARGEYLAKAGTCFLCHVQMNPDGSYAKASFGAGGMRVEQPTLGTVFTRNLTPDRRTGLGGWTADDLRRAFREGRSRNGRSLSALDMPWILLAELSDADVEALHAYLQSLPPIENLVPPPRAPGWRAALVDKLGMVLRGEQMSESYLPLNAGIVPPATARPEVTNPYEPLWFGLVLCLGLVWLARRVRRAALFAGAPLATALMILHVWPPLRFMPPGLVRGQPPYERLARWLSMPPVRLPPAPVNTTDPDSAALAERGRYVATFATCSFCHTTGPSLTRLYAPFPDLGGGMRVNWKVFGTTYSRNVTPDVETGLGAWSDDEIRRAITGGVARGGRIMHWQAMPWDHFSNLGAEDLEALIFYLRHVPPAWSRVPPPHAPRAGDAEGDTFYFGYSGEYRPGP